MGWIFVQVLVKKLLTMGDDYIGHPPLSNTGGADIPNPPVMYDYD